MRIMKLSMKWILPMMTLISLVGCGSLFGVKKKNLYYDYEKPKFETEFGAFYASFTPEPKLDVVKEKEVVVWTDPYQFNAQYFTDERIVRHGKIENVRITSVASGKVVLSDDLIENQIIKQREGDYISKLKKFLAFGSEIPSMGYEDYRIVFDYTLYVDDETVFEKGMVDIVVKSKCYEVWK